MSTDSFQLEAPPGFRGFDPDSPVQTYVRHLPHWRQAGATYFVTFRLADSIPQSQLASLKRWRAIWEKNTPAPRSKAQWEELACQITAKTERWLDEGYGSCVLRDSALSNELKRCLLKFQDQRYTLNCYVIMPNHVHLCIKPHGDVELEDILKGVKGSFSRLANTHLGRTGPLWESESYDRIVRDEEHLFKVVQYIGRNPAKAGLSAAECIRWIQPAWEEAGWRFSET